MSEFARIACPPPDPEPRPPRTAVPPGACDTHFHVIGPLAEHPVVENRTYDPPDASLAALRHVHRTLGIERGVFVQVSVHGTDNAAMLKALSVAGDGYRGIAVADETVTDAELEAWDGLGVRGLRLNVLFGGGVGLEPIRRLADRIKDLGWHLQLLVDVSEIPEFARMVDGLPVEIVVDHMGYVPTAKGAGDPGFQDLLALLRGGRTWVKLSGPTRTASVNRALWPDVVPFAHALVEANPDRCLWGSDWPHVATPDGMPNDGDLLDLLADWVPDEVVRRKVLVDNPAVLYGFPELG